MSKRIILVGPAAAGKDFLKKKFKDRGFKLDVSYTTRPIREGEVKDGTYHYISFNEFTSMIAFDKFYEYAKHGEYYYGTGLWEWNNLDVFIMETHGISQISEEDRKSCFIMYLNPPLADRIKRLKELRGWDDENISHRTTMDDDKFNTFVDYDIEINNPKF